MMSTFCDTIFWIIASNILSVQSASCNYYSFSGLAVGVCDSFISTQESIATSRRYDCLNATHLRYREWDNSGDCSGNSPSTQKIWSKDGWETFNCDTGSSECSLIKITNDVYIGSTNCSGNKTSGVTWEGFITDYNIECEKNNEKWSNEYYTRTVNLSQGIYHAIYDNSSCSDDVLRYDFRTEIGCYQSTVRNSSSFSISSFENYNYGIAQFMINKENWYFVLSITVVHAFIAAWIVI